MLYITLKSFKNEVLNIYLKFLIQLFKKLHFNYSIVSIPKRKKKITLLKSPHVYKKAREQFEICSYKKLILIKNFNNLKYLKNIILSKPKLITLNIKQIGK